MSHEIRTPLNGILGFSELLSEDNLDENIRKSYAEMIQNSGNQLLNIIGDILDISKIESNQMKIRKLDIEVCTILKSCLSTAEHFRSVQGNREIQLRLIIPEEFENFNLHTDPFRLTQILDNLISNALKNTDAGFVEFGIKGIDVLDGIRRIGFYVQDSGVGIKKENFEVIFERFGRIQNERIQRGNGIGLCISKALVELLGGSISLESEYKIGSTFYFNILID